TQRIEACAPDPPTMVTSRRGTRMDEAAQAGSAVGDGPPPLVIAGDIGGSSSRPVLALLDGGVIAVAGGPGGELRSAGAGGCGPPPLVIAGDIGGTSSRLVLALLDGAVIAEAEGPGANLRSSGADAFDHVASTTREVLERGRVALGGHGEIAAVALGVSGAGPARAAEVRRAVSERPRGLGIDADRIRVTDDLHTAFLAGGVGDDGLLVLAGTGAVSVRFHDREAVARRDGMGWLLGDIGSAVWLGRRTLEAVAADLD